MEAGVIVRMSDRESDFWPVNWSKSVSQPQGSLEIVLDDVEE